MKKEPKSPHLKRPAKISLKDRPSKVRVEDFCKPHRTGSSLKSFLEGLPGTLAAKDLKEIAQRTVTAYRRRRPIIFGMGAHVIKVGLNPLLIDLMEKGFISCIAMNGAGAIHDVEIALAGKTSEDVATGLREGQFGMAPDAAQFINQAVHRGRRGQEGMGTSIGKRLLRVSAPYNGMSLLAAGAQRGIPVTVHVSIGTDTIHMHPTFDGAATGALTQRDFLTFSSLIARLEGGVFFNIGSAVIIPEVFLKALSLAKSRGALLGTLTTVNMDFIRHYRPSVNVVERPTLSAGKGYHLIGHHEIMLPLLAATILEEL